MVDVHDIETRSYNMSRIKGKDTNRKCWFGNSFMLMVSGIVCTKKNYLVNLPKYNTVIQVYSCFWHGHNGCKYYVVPQNG
jgi:DNA mismatch endonuclease (patch repair protein)